MTPHILYRNENYGGSGITAAAEVLEHEIFELRNDDIPDTISDRYATGAEKQKIERTLDGFRESMESGEDIADSDKEEFVNYLLGIVRKTTGKDIRHVLWLAEKLTVKKDYKGNIPGADIRAYPTSGVILSDLGEDGYLFGYVSEPENLPM